MEKEFIPYEQALVLKELGFDHNSFVGLGFVDNNNVFYTPDNAVPNTVIWSPTFSQAFRWFREKYDLVIEPCVPFQRLYLNEDDHFEILEFGYRIYSFDQYRGGLRDKIEWDGYDNSNEEEAELECLKKLIEIVKNKRESV